MKKPGKRERNELAEPARFAEQICEAYAWVRFHLAVRLSAATTNELFENYFAADLVSTLSRLAQPFREWSEAKS
jgi:hypothetical protein